MNCPFCEFTADDAALKSEFRILAEHLIEGHGGDCGLIVERVVEHHRLDTYAVTCWCGHHCQAEAFRYHLEDLWVNNKESVAAHALEHILNPLAGVVWRVRSKGGWPYGRT